MTRQSFYADRILWKAQSYKLFQHDLLLFNDLDSDLKRKILARVSSQGTPVVIFIDSEDKWTLRTEESLISVYDDCQVSLPLDEIKKSQVNLARTGFPGRSAKYESEFLTINNQIRIWTPPKVNMIGLIAILKMFPLRIKA